MLWFRKELVTVFALVLVTVRATDWCDMTKVNRFDEAGITGTMYQVLSTRNLSGLFGFVNAVVEEEGNRDLIIQMYKLNGFVCSKKVGSCKIIGNGCEANTHIMYVIGSDPSYVVTYVRNHQFQTVDIYTKLVDQALVTLTNLSPVLLAQIRYVCGLEAIRSAFYQTMFPVINFIPACLNDQDINKN